MTLREAQEQFKDELLRHRHALANDTSAFAALFEHHGADFTARLNVYHNNVVGTLARGLANKFPYLALFMGDDYLMQCTRQFVIENPPQNADLASYGAGFDIYLSKLDTLAQMKWLVDIAKLEICVFLSQNAQDDIAIGLECLQSPLTLRKNVFVLESEYALEKIELFSKDKQITDEALKDFITPKKSWLLVYRPELHVKITSIAYEEYYLLLQIKNGAAFQDALGCAISLFPDFDFSNALNAHISKKLYAAL